jgi:A/G-specific adenine glycosylase
MWEFPRAVVEGDDTTETAARKLIASLGVTAEPGPELMTLRYGVTRFRITMACLEAAARRKAFRSAYYAEGRWLAPAELAGFPVSSAQRKLAEALRRPIQRGLY